MGKNTSSGRGSGSENDSSSAGFSDKKFPNKQKQVSADEDVLLKVGPLKYKIPGRRQRIIVASIVVTLNMLLVIAVILYLKNPTFQQFIFNVGRN